MIDVPVAQDVVTQENCSVDDYERMVQANSSYIILPDATTANSLVKFHNELYFNNLNPVQKTVIKKQANKQDSFENDHISEYSHEVEKVSESEESQGNYGGTFQLTGTDKDFRSKRMTPALEHHNDIVS